MPNSYYLHWNFNMQDSDEGRPSSERAAYYNKFDHVNSTNVEEAVRGDPKLDMFIAPKREPVHDPRDLCRVEGRLFSTVCLCRVEVRVVQARSGLLKPVRLRGASVDLDVQKMIPVPQFGLG